MSTIRQLREQMGIDQSYLARKISVSQPTISDWENGRKMPSNKSALKLADFFGVSVDYILGREEKKTEQLTEYDGLSEKQKTLIDFAKSVPEEKAEMILRVMKTIVEGDQ